MKKEKRNFKIVVLEIVKKKLPITNLVRYLNLFVRNISSYTHNLQYKIEWSIDNPEHFDHFMDINWKWKKNMASFPMERGVFSSYSLPNESLNYGNTLDLCCGDGFYTYFFYALRSKKITGIDFDKNAIKWAKRNFKSENLDFVLGDIRKDIPNGPYKNIMWDAGIEHFTENEIKLIMHRIKEVLLPEGILSGYTIKEPEHIGKHLHQHEYEFKSKDDLVRFLSPYFKNVHVLETVYPQRTNYYFYASDSMLPMQNIYAKIN